MSEERWNLPEGLDREPLHTVVDRFREIAHTLMRDKGVSRELVTQELGKIGEDYVRQHQLGMSARAHIGYAITNAGAEAWRQNVQSGGRYVETIPPTWFEQQQASTAAWRRQQEQQARDAAEKAASEANYQAHKAASANAQQQYAIDTAVAAAVAAAQAGTTKEAVQAAKRVARRAAEAARPPLIPPRSKP